MVVSFPLFRTLQVFGEVTKVGSPGALNAVQTLARPSLPRGCNPRGKSMGL